MYFGWRSASLKLPPSDWWTFMFSHSSASSTTPPEKKSAAGVTFTGGTDRNGIPSPLYEAVIEYHIYYFPIHKAASVASISRALSDFISSAWDDLNSSAPLLSAKSAFVSLGTLRTFKLITLSTFGCLCPPPPSSPQLQPSSAPRLLWIMIFLHWGPLLKVENEARLSVGQTSFPSPLLAIVFGN